VFRLADDGIVTYRFESIAPEQVAHAVFTRRGGVSRGPFSSLNVGHSVGDEEHAVNQNHARVFSHLGLSPSQVTSAGQVHGNRVQLIGAHDAGHLFPATDGLVTDASGIALLLRFADCQPIFLYDPKRPAIGLVHAGWRGIAQGIAHRAVEAMHRAFDTQPEALLVGLGPAIGPCCYTVGDDVASALGYALPKWKLVMHREGDAWRLDLSAANAQQLAAAGVQRIEQSGLCTACHPDEFYSHRASGGSTGRFAVVACLASHDGAPKATAPKPARKRSSPADAYDSLHSPALPPLGAMPGDTE